MSRRYAGTRGRGLLAAALLAFTTFGAAAQGDRTLVAQAGPGGGKSELRQLLERMTGSVFNIAGGLGRSADDPIVILDADPHSAAVTEIGTMGALARGLGYIWRLAERVPPAAGGTIEVLRIDVVEFTDTTVNSGTLDFFFDIAASGAGEAGLPTLGVDVPRWRRMPLHLAWAHLAGFTDYEANDAGLGYGIAYKMDTVTLSVFIYSGDGGAARAAGAARAEFDRALAELRQVHPGAREFGGLVAEPDLWRQDFIIDGNWSSLGLTVADGLYVKYRMSGPADRDWVALAEDCIAALRAEVAGRR